MSKRQPGQQSAASQGRQPLLPVIIALIAALAFILTHVDSADRHLVAVSQAFDPLKNSEQAAPLLMRSYAVDSYMWLQHAQDIDGLSDLRYRYTQFDNAPDGRPVHWVSDYSWYLKVLGMLRNLVVPSEDAGAAIARMAIWSNAILLSLFLGLVAWMVRNPLGSAFTVALILATICLPAFYESFLPAYPDHHGLIALFITVGLLGLLAATRPQAPSGNSAICWSAIAFGLSFWVSAVSTTLVLAALGVGLLCSCWLLGRWPAATAISLQPELFRTWGRWGAATSLILYLLEYVPMLPLTSLEINHPLYALAWLGGSEILAVTCPRLLDGKLWPDKKSRLRLGLALLAVFPLITLLLFGGSAWHVYGDPFLREVYAAVSELQPLSARLAAGTLSWSGIISISGIFILTASLILLAKCPSSWHRWSIAALLLQFMLLTLLQLYQIRWGVLAAPTLAVLAAVAVDGLWQLTTRYQWQSRQRTVVAVIIAAAALLEPWSSWRTEISRGMDSERVANPTFSELQPLMLREIGLVIQFDTQNKPPVLLSTPEYSLLAAYFGGFQTIGTLYWENLMGMKAAAAMLSAPNDEQAKTLLASRGVTHILLMPDDVFLPAYFAAARPAASEQEYRQSFGYRLLTRASLPDWLEEIPYPSAFAKQLGVQPRIFRVVDNKGL